MPGQSAPATTNAERRGEEAGTVQTVAGPDFCTGGSRFDPGSALIGALAVDPGGKIAFDTGRSDGGVAVVAPDGGTRLLRTGVPVSPGVSGSRQGRRPEVLPASRLAADGQGGFFMAAGSRVDHLEASGLGISTAFGGGPQPASGDASLGDGGPAQDARFAAILSIATDSGGNLYVADAAGAKRQTWRVRFINRSAGPVSFFRGTAGQIEVPPGGIDTIAGGNASGVNGTGAPGGALEGRPGVMAVSGETLYLASFQGTRRGSPPRSKVLAINLGAGDRVINGQNVSPGSVKILAGGRSGFGGDGGPARTASFSVLTGIAAGPEGDLLVADSDNHRIRKVDASGKVTTVAGGGEAGYSGNDGPAERARLNRPFDVDIGPGGRIYISDRGNNRVRWVDRSGSIRVAPGGGAGLAWRCAGRASGGRKSVPSFQAVGELAAGSSGNTFFLADGIKRLAPSGAITPLRGSFGRPVALAAADRGLYVRDSRTARVLFLNLSQEPVRVHGVEVASGETKPVAGGGTTAASPGPGVPGATRRALEVRLSSRGSVAADRKGNLYLGEEGGVILHVDRRGEIRPAGRPNAGVPDCAFSGDVEADSTGNVYFAGPYRVCVLNPGPTQQTLHGVPVPAGGRAPVAGAGEGGATADRGPALSARLRVWGIAVDDKSNLYLSDPDQHTVSRVDATGTITRAIGTGQSGFNGDGLKGPVTALSFPSELTVDACGDVLVFDGQNERIRRLVVAGSCRPTGAAPVRPAPRRSSPALLIAAFVLAAAAVVVIYRFLRRKGSGMDQQGRDEDWTN